MNSIISCDIQDHFEHACVLRLPVKVYFNDGSMVEGTAWDIQKMEGVEWLVLRSPDVSIPLTKINTLKYPHNQGDETINGKPWRVIHL